MNYSSIAMAMASGLRGRSFVLVMEHDQGFDLQEPYNPYRNNPDVSFHPRESQPCWGELRKYDKDYPDECTQPANKKPTDLWHKFPAGRPLGLAVDFSVCNVNESLGEGSQTTNRVMEKIFDKKHSIFSPMIGNVEFLYNNKKNIVGFYMSNLDIDPTALVHFLRQSYNWLGEGAATVKAYVDAGLTWREAMAVHYLNRAIPLWRGYMVGYGGFQHNIKRLLEGNPRDLSGGTLRDRVDYNRTSIDELFCYDPEEPKGPKWEDICKEAGFIRNGLQTSSPMTAEEVVKRIKPQFEKIMADKKKTGRKLWVWKLNNPKKFKLKQKVAA